MSLQQTQIDALEHLVLALFKELDTRTGLPLSPVINSAKASLLGSDGPGGPEQKSAAVGYLEQLESRIKSSRRS